jgi:hypothetical protein
MSIETSIQGIFLAIEKGAASVYHQIVATGLAVNQWEESHPEVQPLIAIGLNDATSTLTRFGVPVGTIELVGSDILAACKHLAAGDATVQSGAAAVTTVQSGAAAAATVQSGAAAAAT